MKVLVFLAILHLSSSDYIVHVVENNDLDKCIDIPGYRYSINESLEVYNYANISFTNLSYPYLPNGEKDPSSCLMINLTNVQLSVSGTYKLKGNRFIIKVIDDPKCITNFKSNNLLINDNIIITCKKTKFIYFMRNTEIMDSDSNETHIILKHKLMVPVTIKLVYINNYYQFIIEEFKLTDVLSSPHNMKCEPDGQYFKSFRDVKCTALGNPNPQVTLHNQDGHIINVNDNNSHPEFIYFMICNRIRQKTDCISSYRMYKTISTIEEISNYYYHFISILLTIWVLLICTIVYYKY